MKWYNRFLNLAEHVSMWSLDPSTKVGALIIDKENHVRSVGYNGFPRDIQDDERLNDRELKYKMVVHAELNALMACSKLGIKTQGCILVCTHHPCSTCCGAIIQAGIKKIVIRTPSDDFIKRWGTEIGVSRNMLIEAGLEIIEVKD